MKKLKLDIEVGSNGGFVVTWYKNEVTSMQRFAGVKDDIERLAFENAAKLTEWITKQKGN